MANTCCGDERLGRPRLRFGEVRLCREADAYRQKMNHEMIALLKSLPSAMHADALVFFMGPLGIPILPQFDFFRRYFTPAWSVLYWLEQRAAPRAALSSEARRKARTAHAMALFLHWFDDHLHDDQLPASHLTLLLRSQAWLRMNAALEQLAAGVADGQALVSGYFNDYYGSIDCPPEHKTLDGYCDHFRKQMATGMIVPRLLAALMACGDGFRRALEKAYGSFGIAWRLLDDWLDLATDLQKGCQSAVYFGLPPEIRPLWDRQAQAPDRRQNEAIRRAVVRNGVGGAIERRIRQELELAATTLETIEMAGLAAEMRCLAAPIGGKGGLR